MGKMSSEDKGTKILLAVIVVIIGILAVVAIIIAAVSLGSSNRPDVAYQLPAGNGGGGSSSGQMGGGGTTGDGSSMGNIYPVSSAARNKIWMIAVGHDWGAMEYIDSSGFLAGFQFDLIAEVCAAAGIQCRTVWEPYKNCYDSEPGQHSFGGPGLMGRWYDACTGWLQTVGRSQIYDFSMPWFKDEPAYFWVKKDSSFNWKDVTGKKIGFLDGWWTDEKCLARMDGVAGTPIPKDSVVHYQTTTELFAAVKDGSIDAAYGADLLATGDRSEIKRTGDGYLCSVSGSSMMTRKDNGFAAVWNSGFQQLVASGRFKKLCEEGKAKHENDGRKLSECV